MYIYIKIFDNKPTNGCNIAPFIIEENNLSKAILKIIEKYYNEETCQQIKGLLI